MTTGALSGAVARAARPWWRAAALPGMVAACAWSALWAAGRSPVSEYLSHDVLSRASVPLALAVGGLLAGWLLMVAAMMLPITLFGAGSASLSARWLIGYLGVWSLAGIVFASFDAVLHTVIGPGGEGRPIPAAAVTLAVIWYVVTMRRPRRLPGGRSHGGGFPGGWLHGLACVRACWAGMLGLQAAAPESLVAMALAALWLGFVRLRPVPA